MSQTVLILIVSWLCFISVSKADLGASCNETVECTATVESCTDGSCECSSGYFNVSNESECKSSSITVELKESTNAVYGSDVILTAIITSEVPINTIKWLNGSTELNITSSKYTQIGESPGQVTLTIHNVNFGDRGDYQVEVNNAAGITNTSNQVSLTVTGEKPTVTVPGTIYEIGTTVTIHCTASGSPALTAIHWILNGTNLDFSDSAKYSERNVSNPSLSIKNLTSTDAGVYLCMATNVIGSTTSTKSVTLAPPSVSVLQQPENPVYNGTKIRVNGSYTSDLLRVKRIKWQRLNGNVFSDINITDDKYKESTDSGSNPTLVITKVDFIDKTSFRLTVSNGVGITSSDSVSLNVIDGSISVSLTTSSSSARYGSDVILSAVITSTAFLNHIKWQKVSSGGIPENLNITSPKYKQNGVGPGKVTLTIHNVNFTDMGDYQVEVSNAAGNIGKSDQVSFSVRVGQFDENCTNQQICNISKDLECTEIKRCRCKSAYYHNNQVCYKKTRLAPIIIHLNSTNATLSVFWSPPANDSKLVAKYEVTWKVNGASMGSSVHLDNSKNRYTVPSGLMSGQIYIVNVISHANLTNPEQPIVVTSADSKERLTPLAPGPILMDQSNFTYNNLQIRWTQPSNTLVTEYEVIIDGTKYTTNSTELVQFNGKNFTPGKYYNVTIVTVSGITDVKKSVECTKQIRITPTKPGPPTDVSCPEVPLDVSLQLSWKAPNKTNGVILQYQITIHLDNPRVINVSSTDLSKNVEGLSPEQSYTFSVSTINDAEESIRVSDPSNISCTTKAGVSSPPTNLMLEDVKSRGFRIGFGIPINVSGILAGYKILIQQKSECKQQILVFESHCNQCVNMTSGCPDPLNFDVDNISMPVSYTATGLNPYTNYFVRVTAINGVGEGYSVNATAMTEEEVPQTPEQITASSILSRSLTLFWNLPAPSPGNTIYTIFVYEANDEGTGYKLKENLTVYGFSTQLTQVTGLEEYWQYKFKVNAATGKGNTISEFSNKFRTLQAAPGQVVDLTVGKIKDDYRTAFVSWSLPTLRDHNGILVNYLFRISHDEVTKLEKIPVSLSDIKVERNISVMPETTYVVTVILQNNQSMNSSTSLQEYTASAGPPPVSNMEPIDTEPGGHNPTESTITVKINADFFKNEYNGKQVFFGIAVCEASKCTGLDKSTYQDYWKKLPNWHKASTSGYPLYRVTNDTFMEDVRQGVFRKKRSTSASNFIIGEDKNCAFWNESVYCNGPLSSGTTYSVTIFGCTSGGCTYSKAAGPYETIKIQDDFPIGIIVGVVVAVVVVAVIVGVAFVIVRRRNRLGETKKYTKGLENPTTLDEPVSKNIPRKRPIKLKELSDKVAEKHKDSNLHFAREYEDLKALSPKHPAETSELDSNKLKNRYVNILPFDHSRVKLMLTEDDDPSTDFINANYLPGYKSQREYIATQGPIPGTIDDFWRMIWEQNVSIIVMLTLCKEEGRVKCEMYWPENSHEPKQYGDLVVETVSNSTVNFYEFKIFKIKLGDTTRSVKHFHFLQWKDFSANVQNDVMIDFIKNVRNHIRPPDMNGPVVVHCSAGVGRTGTYCALDHLFQFVDEHELDKSIDIFDLVMNLRERRMFMVQTEQQYVFIHDCVRDYVERKKKELQGNLLYENVNRGFVADEDPMEESLYQNYSNQRTDL